MPYPPGPYGVQVGGVMPDLTVLGYRLSREQRDASKLPFESIRLSEVRSDPACQYVLVSWQWSGDACPPCVQARQTLTSIVAREPTFCALEIIAHPFDAAGLDVPGVSIPPTRTDLDTVVAGTRESFPVGLATPSVTRAGLDPIPSFPDLFVLRKDDMRVLAFLQGTGTIETRIRAAIAQPWAPVEELAADGSPRRLAVSGNDVFLADATKGIVRLPATSIAPISGDPLALAVDDAFVYWATSSAIARAPKAGGPSEELATANGAYTSLHLDGATLWFTSQDGTVASIPIGGGAPSVLATGEASPTSVTTTTADVLWLAGGSIVAMARGGGARRTFLAPAYVLSHTGAPPAPSVTLTFEEVATHGDDVWVRFASTSNATVSGGYFHVDFQAPTLRLVGITRTTTIAFTSSGGLVAGSGDGTAGFLLVDDPAGRSDHTILTLGQHDIPSLALTPQHAYWIDVADGVGRLRRIPLP